MGVMRKALLAASTNAWMRDHLTQYGFVKRSVRRFMPGETIEEALAAARDLQRDAMTTILTRLGENLTRVEEFEEVTQHYLEVLDKVAASGLDAQVSVKPTQLGLDLDPALCERNLERLLDRAGERGNFVWIDMESSPYVDRTLDLYRKARARSPRVGVALQAYLYRTAKDLESLLPLGSAIRIVKGAYLEPPAVAFPEKADVDKNYVRLMERLLLAGNYPGLATHDEAIIAHARRFVRRHDIGTDRFEFQMLYGVRRDLQEKLRQAGHRLRVYIPFGTQWYPYLMRRLAERPANIAFVLGNIVRESVPGR